MKQIISLSIFASLLMGCSTTSMTNSPYKQPDGADTASVRFRISRNIPLMPPVYLRHFDDEECKESPQGRYIDEIGANKTFVSRANQSIGMPKQENFPPYTYVERRVVGGRPFVFTLAASTGPQRICDAGYSFTPNSGEMYEINIDILGLQSCPAYLSKIREENNTVIMAKEPTLKRLSKVCESPSALFN